MYYDTKTLAMMRADMRISPRARACAENAYQQRMGLEAAQRDYAQKADIQARMAQCQKQNSKGGLAGAMVAGGLMGLALGPVGVAGAAALGSARRGQNKRNGAAMAQSMVPVFMMEAQEAQQRVQAWMVACQQADSAFDSLTPQDWGMPS